MSGDPRNPGFFERGLGGFLDETHRFALDVVTVDSVDVKRKEVTVSSWNLMSPITCQWASPLFNAQTGNGMYVVPEVGSHGILAVIKDEPVFLAFTGLLHRQNKDGFSDNREEVPPGAGVFRTTPESKQIWAKNFMLLQAANLCKMLFTRAKKQLQATFFNLMVTCLGGMVSWTAKPDKSRDVTFLWRVRNKTPPQRGPNGNLVRDDSLQVTVRMGAPQTRVVQKAEDKQQKGRILTPGERQVNIFSLEVDRVESKLPKIGSQTFGSAIEDIQVRAFRDLLYDLFAKRQISNFASLSRDTALAKSVGKFCNAQEHSTKELIIEALVGLAGFVDTGSGIVVLKPEAAGAQDSAGFPIPANPLDEPPETETVVDEEADLGRARDSFNTANGSPPDGFFEDESPIDATGGDTGGAFAGGSSSGSGSFFSDAINSISSGLSDAAKSIGDALSSAQRSILQDLEDAKKRIADDLGKAREEAGISSTGGTSGGNQDSGAGQDAGSITITDRPLHDLLVRARTIKDKDDLTKLTERFRASVGELGGVFIKHLKGAEWHMVEDMIMATTKGKFDLATKNGIMMKGRGVCILGNKACGIVLGEDGMVKIFGTGIELHPYIHTSTKGVTDKGTSVKIFPAGITISSGGGILMTSRGQIRQTPGSLRLPSESRSVSTIRNQAIASSKIPGAKES